MFYEKFVELFAVTAPCKHIAPIGYLLIDKCEGDPFYPFTLRQLDIASVCARPLKRVRDRSNAPSKRVCVMIDDDEECGSTTDRPIVCDSP